MMNRSRLWVIFYCMCLLVTTTQCSARKAKIIRGPYLQLGTDSSIIIRWRTSTNMSSHIVYGDAVDNLTQEKIVKQNTTEHVVKISGLQPDTKYYYAILKKNKVWMGAKPEYSFITYPVVGSEDKLRFWILGDSGTGNRNARAVRDAYYEYAKKLSTDGIILLGDNAYSSGSDRQYQKAMFEDMYEEMLRNTVTWPAPGNHDFGSANSETQSGVYYDIFTMPTEGEAGGLASGTEAYYSFDIGNIHFISLDSHDSDRKPGSPMLMWLENDLLNTLQKWIVAFWHHPPYSKGSHDSDNERDSQGRMGEMRRNVLPILESGGVDLVLTGHSHSYERSYLLHGHYERSDSLEKEMILDKSSGKPDKECSYHKSVEGENRKGTVYIVGGSSGKVSGNLTLHPVMYTALYQLGSTILEVEENRMDLKFINDKGDITDYFTIIKDAGKNDTVVLAENGLLELTASWPGDDTYFWKNNQAETRSISVSDTGIYIVTSPNECISDTFRVVR